MQSSREQGFPFLSVLDYSFLDKMDKGTKRLRKQFKEQLFFHQQLAG
jgi:hypothetical protein